MTTGESGKVSDAIAAVERQIADLWAPEEGAPPKSRACTANVVVVAAAHEVAAAESLASSIATADLARTFVVHLDPKMAPWGIEASVSAHCQKGEGGVVCAERIDLALGAMTYTRAASIVDALAVSEVPQVLVVPSVAPPLLVAAFAEHANRVIVDGDVLGLEAVAAIAGATKACVVDLAWLRLHPWRNQLARCFDDPATRPAVTAIRRLAIAYSAGSPDRARRLVGWLASRLGWKLVSATQATDPRHGAIALEVLPRASDAPVGAILAIDVDAGLDDLDASFSLARAGDPPRVDSSWTTAARGHGTRSAPIFVPPLAELVDRAISDPSSDAVLRAALTIGAAFRPHVPPAPEGAVA